MALLVCNSRVVPAGLSWWQGRLLTGAGLVLLPWMGFLAGTLPPAEAAAWVALDALEALCLLTAGRRLLCGGGGYRAPAAGAALLLVADAWVDVLTSAPGVELVGAVVLALCAELPLAVVCGRLAVRGGGRGRGPRRGLRRGRTEAGRAAGPAGL